MDRQKSCGNDRLQVVMRAFHRYKYDKSYGVLLALILTMKKRQLQNDNFLITLRKIDSYSVAVRILCVAAKEVGGDEKNTGRSLLWQHHTQRAADDTWLRTEAGDGSRRQI